MLGILVSCMEAGRLQTAALRKAKRGQGEATVIYGQAAKQPVASPLRDILKS